MADRIEGVDKDLVIAGALLHDMGKVKYQNLGIDYALKDVEPLPKEEAAKARDIIMQGIRDGLAAERSQNNWNLPLPFGQRFLRLFCLQELCYKLPLNYYKLP